METADIEVVVPEVEEVEVATGAAAEPANVVLESRSGKCADCGKLRQVALVEGKWLCLYDLRRRIGRYKKLQARKAAEVAEAAAALGVGVVG